MFKRCIHLLFLYFCAFFIFLSSFSASAKQTEVPQQVLDWQKAAQDSVAAKNIPSAISYYEQIVRSFSNTPYALDANVQIICLEIKSGQDEKAYADVQLLQQNYFSHADYYKAIQTIGSQYRISRKRDLALALYLKTLEQCPGRKETIGLKQGIVEMYLEKKKRSSADTVLESLMSQYSDTPGYARAILDIAGKYRSEAKDYAKGRALYIHLLERFGNGENAWRCQNGIVKTYLEEWNLSGADREMDRLLSRYNHPDMAGQIVDLGWIYLKKFRKPDRAVELCNRLYGKFPDTSQSVRIQGLIIASYMQKGNQEQASKEMDVLLRKYLNEPDFVDTVQALSKACRENKQFTRVVELQQILLGQISESKEVIPEMGELAAGLIRKGDFIHGQAVMEDMQEKFSGRRELGDALNTIAHAWLEKMQYDKALALYSTVRRSYVGTRDEVEARMGMAVVYLNLGQEDKTQAEIDQLKADANRLPKVDGALYEIGEGYLLLADKLYKERKTEELILKCQKAMAVLEPLLDWPRTTASVQHAWYSMGTALRLTGDYENAAWYYQAVVDQWPDYMNGWNAQYFVGYCYEELKKTGTIDPNTTDIKIEEAYKKTIEKYPDGGLTRLAYLSLGDLCMRNKRYVEAIGYYEQYRVKGNPKDPFQDRIKWDLAWLYDKTGDIPKSRAMYEQLIRTPDDALRQRIISKEINRRNQQEAGLQREGVRML